MREGQGRGGMHREQRKTVVNASDQPHPFSLSSDAAASRMSQALLLAPTSGCSHPIPDPSAICFPHHSPIHFGCHVRMGLLPSPDWRIPKSRHTGTPLRPHDTVPLCQGERHLASAWPWCPSLCLSQAFSGALSKPCQS